MYKNLYFTTKWGWDVCPTLDDYWRSFKYFTLYNSDSEIYNEKSRLTILVIGLLLLITISTGCTDSDSSKGYHKPAKEYMLTDSEVGSGWTLEEKKESKKQPDGLESSWVKDFVDGEDKELQIAVLIFGSVGQCKEYYGDHKQDSEGYSETYPYSLGDDGFTFTYAGLSVACTRKDNVLIQSMYEGSVSISKSITEKQYDKVKEMG